MTLTGKTALVTGGSRGIGRAIVERLAAAGARVVFTYRDNAAAAGEVTAKVPGTVAVRADQEDLGNLAAMFAPVRDGLDILVNNAALVSAMPIEKLEEEDIDRAYLVNVKFPLLAIREAVPLLRDGGRIVNISTLNTVAPAPGLALYCSTKGALEQITAVAAKELGPRGITVNTVSPGATDTDLLRGVNPPEALERAAETTALRRLGRPADVAAVVAFLASPDGGWVTGQNIRATGGL
ncbi:SDR family oxidoreductase [Paractinoplanes atraurantiacus]|uniref:3-oxoacyl-[acyl-carrier protein] reductase n=1 Tax=Paractinoplanes atraurantiacus TaxID=1036182 RepID=A0A285I537_9ACTN|nr:SDR family oxidoreductase [Actinoplanes atraurantiacus]SNY42186.1 3-oxoacyl-[acyl-carrier protein] reductase [Actinoplanes atraurantiacus]